MATVAKPWTAEQDAILRAGRTGSAKVPFERLAAQLGRSLGAVGVRAAYLGLVNERSAVTPEMIARAMAMREKDRSWKTIGQILSVSSERIRLACVAASHSGKRQRGVSRGERIKCLGFCGTTFITEDRVRHRICDNCKRTDAHGLPGHW
jgi:hypothetical protein